MLLFIGIQLVTTILSTLRVVLTVEASKTVAAVINAISYTLGAVLTKLITGQEMEVVILVTFFSNLIGVFIAKFILEKMKKERLWIINATVKEDKKEKIEKDLRLKSIQYTLIEAKNNRNLFSIYSYSRGESMLIREILDEYHIKHSIIESDVFNF